MKHQGHKGGPLRQVVRAVTAANKPLAALLAAAVLGAVVLALLPPLVLERIVNALVSGQPVTPGLAALYFGVLALAGVFDAGKEMLITVYGQKITHGLRSALCQKLNRLPAGYFTRHEAGAITSRMVNDVDTVEALFTGGIIGMCVDVCKVAGILVVVFTKSLGLGVLLAVTAPLLFAMTRIFQQRMLGAQRANRAAIGRVNQYIPETIAVIRTIHCLHKEGYRERQYDAKLQESYHALEEANLYDSIYSPIVILISTGLIALVMVLSALGGGLRQFFGMSVGTAVAVIAYVGKVFDPIENIGMEIQNIQSAVAGVARINELLAEDEGPASAAMAENKTPLTLAAVLEGRGAGVQLEHVDFSYDGGQQILRDFGLDVRPGELVTLAGRTGAGKSTVFKLLLGLYAPQRGSVRLFGQDPAALPPAVRRGLYGYVEQAFHQVPGTVAEQITLYDPAITAEATMRAARLVGLHEVITALPQGYDTDCAAAAFSQGQRQLLSIARAVAADPPLLLDEITANLDSITERQVLEALARAAAGRTVLSISHRLYENLGSRLVTL